MVIFKDKNDLRNFITNVIGDCNVVYYHDGGGLDKIDGLDKAVDDRLDSKEVYVY